jgi:glutathione reductase (NADPH)
MPVPEFDLIVVGGGSAGVRAARVAAGHGARVLLIEASRLGGTCVIRGCVPKKLLVYASQVTEHFAEAAGYGWQLGEPPRLDWHLLIRRVHGEVARLEAIYQRMLAEAGVQCIQGRARLVSSDRVQVDGQSWQGRRILLATGARPAVPRFPGAQHALTSDQMFELSDLPRRIVVVGGGYIGCEFAGILHGLGAQVILVHRGDRLLSGFDEDLRGYLTDEVVRRGIDLRLHTEVERIERPGDGSLRVHVTGRAQAIPCDAVLMATGRVPDTASLGRDVAGVATGDQGEIRVDAHSRTGVPHVFAAGDCTGRMMLTPVAIREAQAVVDREFGGQEVPPLDYALVPKAVFSQPPVASVGLSEAEAHAAGHEVEIFKADFRPLKHAISGREERMFLKMVVERSTQVVLGAHLGGADAPEILQAIAVAVRAGLTKADFDRTVGIHPTAAEEWVTLR